VAMAKARPKFSGTWLCSWLWWWPPCMRRT
jgi:hypothetical protein